MTNQREIKFRAWLGEEMFYQDENTASRMNGLERFAWKVGGIKRYNPKIMQYIGLKDKNGKEIYEGDILYKRYEDNLESSGVVSWGKSINHSAEIETWCIKLETGIYWLDRSIWEQYEVIGNIYENPELIKN